MKKEQAVPEGQPTCVAGLQSTLHVLSLEPAMPPTHSAPAPGQSESVAHTRWQSATGVPVAARFTQIAPGVHWVVSQRAPTAVVPEVRQTRVPLVR